MWNVLIAALISLAANVLLPALLKWLGLLEETLKNSEAARKLFNKTKPTTLEQFRELLPRLVDAACDDAKLKTSERRKLQHLRDRCTRPLFARAVWNRLCLDPKASEDLVLGQDVSYEMLLEEAQTEE